jgi:hypothetical protein
LMQGLSHRDPLRDRKLNAQAFGVQEFEEL